MHLACQVRRPIRLPAFVSGHRSCLYQRFFCRRAVAARVFAHGSRGGSASNRSGRGEFRFFYWLELKRLDCGMAIA